MKKSSPILDLLRLHQLAHRPRNRRDLGFCDKSRLLVTRPPNDRVQIHCAKCGWRYQVTT